MTSVTCQTAYVKCFQSSRWCLCTHAGGDRSPRAGPGLCFTSATPVMRCSSPGSTNWVVYAPLWGGAQAGVGLPAAPAANGCACSCHHTNGETQENEKTLEILCLNSLQNALGACVSWSAHKDMESWVFTSRLKPTNLLKAVTGMVDCPADLQCGWRECILRDL